MNDRKKEEKAIDYVRRKVAEAKNRCTTTDKQADAVNQVLDVLNMNDYVFIDMTWENACRTLQITGLSLEETVALYKELTSPEEREKYREYKLLKTYERWEAFTNNTAGKLKSFVEKFTRSQNKEQGETLDEESNNPGE